MTDPQESTTQRLSIIAVDDDADYLEYLSSLLVSDGHEVRTAKSAKSFFEQAENGLPDVVLLDIKMGRDSGEEILATIRERWVKLCVIVVTGYPSLDSMRQTFRQDVFDYLPKPFEPDDLRKSLAQAAKAFDLGRSAQDRLRSGIGRQIRLERTQRDWTLKDLSDRASVSVSQLSSIERGAHLPSLESLVAISAALGSRPSDWLKQSGF